MRYVALVVRDGGRWIILFPDFPDIKTTSPELPDAIQKARREVWERVAFLQWHGRPIPIPMPAASLVNAPCYSYSTPVIVAITDPRGPPEDSNLDQFGRL